MYVTNYYLSSGVPCLWNTRKASEAIFWEETDVQMQKEKRKNKQTNTKGRREAPSPTAKGSKKAR